MYLHSVGHALRLRGPLANDSTARMLHVLLLLLAIWLGLCTVILWPFNPSKGIAFKVISLAETALVAALALIRIGLLRQASLVYLAGTWLFASIVIALNGGIRSPVQVLYISLPISAAWLLGYGAALWTAGVCAGTALVFALFEIGGVELHRDIPATPLGLWAVLVQATLIGAVPVAHVLRTLGDTLERLQREVTERERREQALRESEERFRRMADTAPVMIVVSDQEQRATFFNKGWLDFTGRTMEQELSKGWTAGVHPDDLDQCLAGIASSYQARRACRLAYRLRRADESTGR